VTASRDGPGQPSAGTLIAAARFIWWCAQMHPEKGAASRLSFVRPVPYAALTGKPTTVNRIAENLDPASRSRGLPASDLVAYRPPTS